MKPFDPNTAKHGDELFYCGNKAYYIGRSVKDESRSVIEWEKNMSDVYPLGLVENALIQVPANPNINLSTQTEKESKIMSGEIVQFQNSDLFKPVLTTDDIVSRHHEIAKAVNAILVDGTDYGVIEGTSDKPVLLKAGAEKLLKLFGLIPRFVEVSSTVDFDKMFFYYRYRCELYRYFPDLGEVKVADAEGSCNSKEKRYRWRWVSERQLTPEQLKNKDKLLSRDSSVEEFLFAINKAETTGKWGRPMEYWNRFRIAIENGTAEMIEKPTKKGTQKAYRIPDVSYRIENEDIADVDNTILKQAQKRAMVAVTLIGIGASQFFTQDLEELEGKLTALGKRIHTDDKGGVVFEETDAEDAEFVEEVEKPMPQTKATKDNPNVPKAMLTLIDHMIDTLSQKNHDQDEINNLRKRRNALTSQEDANLLISDLKHFTE